MSDADSIKKCTKCDAVKPVESFYARSGGRYRSHCKKCALEATPEQIERRNNAARARYEAKKQELISYQKSYREKNAERLRSEALDRHRKNRTAAVERMRAKYASNPEAARLVAKKYRENNPEKVRANEQNKRAKRMKAEGRYTASDVLRLFSMQRGICIVCRVSLGKKYHVDHVIPIARGGSNNPTNLQLLCPSCNMSKHARDPLEFMQSRGFLL